MKKIKVRLASLLFCICVFIQCSGLIVFAGYYDVYHYQTAIAFKYKISGSSQYLYGYYSIVGGDYNGSGGDGTFSSYLIPVTDGSINKYNLYIVSDRPYRMGYYATNYGTKYTEDEVLEFLSLRAGSSAWNMSINKPVSTGYYVSSITIGSGTNSINDFEIIGQFSENPFYILSQINAQPWLEDDFVLGEDPSGGGGSSIVYDSSIPAPQNLRFKSESVGGFLGIGAKFEHELSWSNGLASPPLFARISAVASTQATADDVPFDDSTVSLLSAETTGGYPADTGVYRVGTDEIASKILPGTSLNKVLEYRIQFYRYVDDKLNVGPVATVHLKTNLFGKYDGYTVTTEYPKDPDNIGESGGSDDFYDKDWSSDGQNYQEYDKDGNLIGSGTSEDSGNPVERLLKSLKDIPKIISSTFKAIFDLMSGVGQLPTILSQLFSFLPPEIIIIVGLGITVAIALRIVGR